METLVAAIGTIAFIATAVVTADRFSAGTSQARLRVPSSPLDHAEKILALRYARHEISAEEYGRMLVILRR